MTREHLAQELCNVIDAATEDMPCRDAFVISSSAIIIAIQRLDSEFKVRADCDFRELIVDYLSKRTLS